MSLNSDLRIVRRDLNQANPASLHLDRLDQRISQLLRPHFPQRKRAGTIHVRIATYLMAELYSPDWEIEKIGFLANFGCADYRDRGATAFTAAFTGSLGVAIIWP